MKKPEIPVPQMLEDIKLRSNFTDSNISSVLKVSRPYLSMLRSGKSKPSAKLTRRIAAYLHHVNKMADGETIRQTEPADDFDRDLLRITRAAGDVLKILEKFEQTPAVIAASMTAMELMVTTVDIWTEQKGKMPKGPKS